METTEKVVNRDVTLLDLQVMQGKELLHKTDQEIAKSLNVTVQRVKKCQKKQGYRDMVIAALEERGYTAAKFAEKLSESLDKTKAIVVDHEVVEVSDNVAQNAALQRWGDILGVDAPKESVFAFAGSSDAELDQQLEEAAKQFGVVEQSGQQAMGDGSSDPESGTLLPV
jgi:hypothetical protein